MYIKILTLKSQKVYLSLDLTNVSRFFIVSLQFYNFVVFAIYIFNFFFQDCCIEIEILKKVLTFYI